MIREKMASKVYFKWYKKNNCDMDISKAYPKQAVSSKKEDQKLDGWRESVIQWQRNDKYNGWIVQHGDWQSEDMNDVNIFTVMYNHSHAGTSNRMQLIIFVFQLNPLSPPQPPPPKSVTTITSKYRELRNTRLFLVIQLCVSNAFPRWTRNI
jgi:hypothetical protein